MNTAVTLDKNPEAQMKVFGVPEGQDARWIIEHARKLMPDDKVLIHVVLDDTHLLSLQEMILFFDKETEVAILPAWDCLPYDRVSPNSDIVAKRVSTLCQLIEWQKDKSRKPRVLITTVNAITQRLMPKLKLESASFIATAGAQVDTDKLQVFLAENGYVRTDTVRESGEYAFRGSIIDMFPSGYEKPVRLDLFGDEVETIKHFDPVTQRTDVKISALSLHPVTEYFLDKESIQNFRSGYREAFGVVQVGDPLYESISEGRRYNGADHWLPLFYQGVMDTLFDYVPDYDLSMTDHCLQAQIERQSQITDFYNARRTLEASNKEKRKKQKSTDVSLSGTIYHPLPTNRLYYTDIEWGQLVYEREHFVLYPHAAAEEHYYSADGKRGRNFSDIRALPDGDVFGELRKHIVALQAENRDRKVLIASYSTGARERLKGLMQNAGCSALVECEDTQQIKKLKTGQTGLIVLTLENGFIAPDMAIITEQDILGDKLARKTKRRKKADQFLTEVSSLGEGDLVVHVDHGVGRFEGLETLQAAGTIHDCLKISYKGGDKLFVPVENIEVLSRFGGDEGAIQLDKLGGEAWTARKEKVKKDLMVMAGHLIEIAANRELKKADKLHVTQELYEEFSSRFPYHETEDQLRAIDNVLDDLDAGRPMDRLVCGDVGFGKTEVALRAAYVAAMSGVQVAIVAPTTILARQHYIGFQKRFANMGLRIEQLSRMNTPKESEQVRAGLKDGTVNIVIGTHALFAESIKFDNLGLLIVDEEQRFGVKQKERLKDYKNNVHILTLTATPIPRTLQMALTGVREMSIIATPPVDRLATRTFVLPFDPMVIREAILREHYRGGQTFYVCPRIKDLQEVEDALKELVPEVKVVAAHGQLSSRDLEDRMTAFYDGQYDVLLATNIIESGLDVPTANTMVVHRADLFGLAQLYQIRGRVGRSKIRAYAYLTYAPHTILTKDAQKRLEVLETLDTLGSGFQLASHDMDIRGTGNLVGEQQSGHLKEVGTELYQQLLEEAVAAAREGAGEEEIAEDRWSPNINIGISVLIPDTYVEDLNIRMSLYRRIAELDDKDDIEAFAAELIDRFGAIPDEVENLLTIVELKQYCRKAGVDRLDAGPKGAVIGFHKDTPPNVQSLMTWMQERRGAVKLRPDQRLVAVKNWSSTEQRIKGSLQLAKELAACS